MKLIYLLLNFFHEIGIAIHNFIISDHKLEWFIGTSLGTTYGFVASNQLDLQHELFYRNLNTWAMGIVVAISSFLVTWGMKKLFNKKGW